MAAVARGRWGEDLAARWYTARGWTIVSRNWRAAGGGEIDLVVWQPGTIVVVEVKARATDRFGTPAEAVGAAKQRQLRRLAAAWLGEHPQHRGALRFDVAAITGTNLEIITAAF